MERCREPQAGPESYVQDAAMKGKGGSSPPLRPPGILGSTFSVPRFHYLLVPVEPVGGGPGEGTQVSQEPPPPQVELDGLQQPQGQAEHEGQVQGPRPARLEPGGLHRCAPRGSRAISGTPHPRAGGMGFLSAAPGGWPSPARFCAAGQAPFFPGEEEERWEGLLQLGQRRQGRIF